MKQLRRAIHNAKKKVLAGKLARSDFDAAVKKELFNRQCLGRYHPTDLFVAIGAALHSLRDPKYGL